MPYRIRWEGHGVYERFFGVLTMDDYEGSHREVTSDLRYSGVRYVIADCLDVQLGPDQTPEAIEEYSKVERLEYLSSPDIIYAVVAADDRIREQTSHFKSLLRSLHPVGFFSTVAEARAWIASNPRRGATDGA